MLLAVLILLTGCAGTQPATAPEKQAGESASVTKAPVEQGLVRLALSEPISTMDVHKNTADYMLPLNIYERLFDIRVNADLGWSSCHSITTFQEEDSMIDLHCQSKQQLSGDR